MDLHAPLHCLSSAGHFKAQGTWVSCCVSGWAAFLVFSVGLFDSSHISPAFREAPVTSWWWYPISIDCGDGAFPPLAPPSFYLHHLPLHFSFLLFIWLFWKTFFFFLSLTKFICSLRSCWLQAKFLLVLLHWALSFNTNELWFILFLPFCQSWSLTCRSGQDGWYFMFSALSY